MTKPTIVEKTYNNITLKKWRVVAVQQIVEGLLKVTGSSVGVHVTYNMSLRYSNRFNNYRRHVYRERPPYQYDY